MVSTTDIKIDVILRLPSKCTNWTLRLNITIIQGRPHINIITPFFRNYLQFSIALLLIPNRIEIHTSCPTNTRYIMKSTPKIRAISHFSR